MAFQFHTTTFGQLVRLLSGNTVFQYPDEIDTLLWKRFLRQDASEHMNSSDRGPSKNETTEDGVMQNKVFHDGEQEIFLVEWYGPDDPEVSDFTYGLYVVYTKDYTVLIQVLRLVESSKLAVEMEKSHGVSTLRPQFRCLHGKLHLCARRIRCHGRLWRQRDCGDSRALSLHSVRQLNSVIIYKIMTTSR